MRIALVLASSCAQVFVQHEKNMSLGSLSLGVRCRTPTPQFPAFLQLSAPSGSMTVCCSRNQPRNILARGNEGQPSVCGFMSWLELARSASAVASCMDLLIDHLMMFGHDHLNATLHARAYPRLQARGRDQQTRIKPNRAGESNLAPALARALPCVARGR